MNFHPTKRSGLRVETALFIRRPRCGHGADAGKNRWVAKSARMDFAEKVEYAAFVPTIDGHKSKAEIRMMFVWPDQDRDPPRKQSSPNESGQNDGVDFNSTRPGWAPASHCTNSGIFRRHRLTAFRFAEISRSTITTSSQRPSSGACFS
jgi:hypothetical protein